MLEKRSLGSHSRKKGVRYRYYVSQAVLQSRKHQAGQVFRVPAPEVEAVIEGYVRCRAVDPHGDVRQLIKAQIDKITIQDASLGVELVNQDNDGPATDSRPRQIVSLPWSKRPFSAVKGIMGTPSTAATADTKANAAILAAIAKAKRWVDALVDGASLPEIAKEEGKGERQIRLLIPLAFVPPNKLPGITGGHAFPTLTDLARSVPIVWNG